MQPSTRDGWPGRSQPQNMFWRVIPSQTTLPPPCSRYLSCGRFSSHTMWRCVRGSRSRRPHFIIFHFVVTVNEISVNRTRIICNLVLSLQSIIFYVVRSPKLKEWLENAEINASLSHTRDKKFVDLDPIFNLNIDEDYDFKESGITRTSFCNVYHEWIVYCVTRRGSGNGQEAIESGRESHLISLCLALSLLGNLEVYVDWRLIFFFLKGRKECIEDLLILNFCGVI